MNIIKILGIAASVAVAGLAGWAFTNPGNKAETSTDHKDENLRTRRYRIDFKTFVKELTKMIPTLTTYGRNWKLIGGGETVGESKSPTQSATMTVEVPVVFFIDDLEIDAFKVAENNEITVDVRSKSRVGSSDLGENRRHVLQLLKALDEKFSSEK